MVHFNRISYLIGIIERACFKMRANLDRDLYSKSSLKLSGKLLETCRRDRARYDWKWKPSADINAALIPISLRARLQHYYD